LGFVNPKLQEYVGRPTAVLHFLADIAFVPLFRFLTVNDFVTTSSRRFQENGTLRLYYHFAAIHLKAMIGQHPEVLSAYYQKHIK